MIRFIILLLEDQQLATGGGDGYCLDDELEDNISFKNPYYCELTTLYWGWKKDIAAEWIGLVHYRRYFYSLQDNKLGITGNHNADLRPQPK